MKSPLLMQSCREFYAVKINGTPNNGDMLFLCIKDQYQNIFLYKVQGSTISLYRALNSMSLLNQISSQTVHSNKSLPSSPTFNKEFSLLILSYPFSSLISQANSICLGYVQTPGQSPALILQCPPSLITSQAQRAIIPFLSWQGMYQGLLYLIQTTSRTNSTSQVSI